MAISALAYSYEPGTGAVTIAWPTVAPTYEAGDIALLYVETANEAPTLSTPSGFEYIGYAANPGSGLSSATRVDVWWCRATSASMPSVVVADPGDHAIALMVTFRGAAGSGIPYFPGSVTTWTGSGSSDFTIGQPSIAGLPTGVMLVDVATAERDDSINWWNNISNSSASLSGYTGPIELFRNNGNGGGIILGYGTLSSLTQPDATRVKTFIGMTYASLSLYLIEVPLAQTFTEAEAVGATESTPRIAQAKQLDAAGATESTPRIAQAKQLDAAGGTDAQSVKATLTQQDSSGGTDQVTGLRAYGTTADAAGAAESATIQVSGVVDGAGAGETAVAFGERLTADAAGATDVATVRAWVADTDSGGGATEDAGSSNANRGDDAFGATDSLVGSIRVGTTEAAGGTDLSSVEADAQSADAAGAAESTPTIAQAKQLDAAGAVDEATRIRPAVQGDSAGASESAFVSVHVFSSDSFGATEGAPSFALYVGDMAGAEERQFKAVSGILDVPRLLTVPPDNRTVLIEREPRTRSIPLERRRVVLGKDLTAKSLHRDSRTVGVKPEDRRYVVQKEA